MFDLQKSAIWRIPAEMRLLRTEAWATCGAAVRDGTPGLLRRAAATLGITRARLPLAVALASAFGLMLLVALASVLALAFYAGTVNTRQLLADRTNLLLDLLENRIETFLTPVADVVRVIGGEIESDANPADLLAERSALHGILAATPQVLGVLFVTPDLRAYPYLRSGGPQPPEDWSQYEPMRALMAAAKPGSGVAWGPPSWSPELKRTVINAKLAVERNGALYGILFAAVGLNTMVQYVDELSVSVGQTPQVGGGPLEPRLARSAHHSDPARAARNLRAIARAGSSGSS